MKTKILALIAIVFAFATIGCNKEGDLSSETTDTLKVKITQEGYIKFTPDQAKVAGIKTDTLKLKELFTTILATGSVEASPGNKVDISLPMEGYVKQIYVRHGQPVKRGQMLLSVQNLEYIDIQTKFLQLKAQLIYQKGEYERQKKLYQEKAIPVKTFQQTESQYLSLLAEYKGLEQKLKILGIDTDKINPDNISDLIVIRSPIDGIVGEIYVNIGQFVQPETKIMQITNPVGYMIMLNVYGKYHSLIKPGQKVEFTVTGSSKPLSATVITVSPSLDPHTKTFYVHAEPDRHYPQLTEGAYVSGKILARTSKVYAIPKLAIVPNGEHQTVYVEIEPYTYKPVEVQTGMETDDYVEIINYRDLLGKPIVISGANYIKAKAQFGSSEE